MLMKLSDVKKEKQVNRIKNVKEIFLYIYHVLECRKEYSIKYINT